MGDNMMTTKFFWSWIRIKILSFTWVHTIVLLHFSVSTTTCVFYIQHVSDIGPVSISSEKAEKYNKILGWQMCQVI